VALDVHNPWQAVAYFALMFNCEDCGTYLDLDSPYEPCSDEWYVQLAMTAFKSGWFIEHPGNDGSMDVMSAWCPVCGLKRGLTQPAYETIGEAKKC